MKASAILDSADFGSDVAESDTHLQHYFVKTSAFKEVVTDQVDLILGPKGSGKTAIFRMLSEPQFAIAELEDAVVVPAFNIQGSVFFQELGVGGQNLDEASLRRMWTAYILSLAGNEVLALELPTEQQNALRSSMQACGLLHEGIKSRGIWQHLQDAMRRLTHPTAIEGSVDVAGGGVGVGGRMEYAPGRASTSSTVPAWARPDFSAHDLIRQISDVLQAIRLRCWVIFDRLDEAFQDDRTLERTALRALLRAHSDISSYGLTLRVKLFLRSDVLDRVTETEGFVNITHLRSLRIKWTRAQVQDMLVRRLIESDGILQFLQAKGIDRRPQVLRGVMATVTEVSKKTKQTKSIDPLTYITERTADASQELNPRNVVSYLRCARAEEMARLQIRDVEVVEGYVSPLISMESMIKAWRSLSSTRLIDTLYAEHNSLRPIFERFRNGPQRFDRQWLAGVLEVESRSPELAEMVRSMEYCGFLSQTGRGIYRIPDLYRPALGLNPKWEEKPIPG